MTLEFFIPIVPVAKGRPRFTMIRGYAHSYTPRKTSLYERDLGIYILQQMRNREINTIILPVKIEATFYMPRPQSRKKEYYHSVRPDLDNLEKALFDAMNGTILKDDALICKKTTQKLYAEKGAEGIRIRITTGEVL